MAAITEEQLLVPSVLDRLIDEDPGNSREVQEGIGHSQQLRDLRQSVRRDLECLLNTKHRCTGYPAAYAELEKSLVNFGLPDFTGTTFVSRDDQLDLKERIERIIEIFEPRLRQVRIELLPSERESRTFRFRIHAMLRAYPAPEPVSFASQWDSGTRTIQVQPEGR